MLVKSARTVFRGFFLNKCGYIELISKGWLRVLRKYFTVQIWYSCCFAPVYSIKQGWPTCLQLGLT